MYKAIPVCIFILFLTANLRAGDVTIIRQVPATGRNQVPADWHTPDKNPGQIAPAGNTEFSGRLDFGGTGKDSGARDLSFDFYTDSHLMFLQTLGEELYIQATLQALRKQLLDSTEQKYGGSFIFSQEKFQFDFSGAYSDVQSVPETGALYTTDGLLKINLSTTIIPAVPLTLSGTTLWKTKAEAGILSVQDNAANANLKAEGDLGKFRFNLFSEYAYNNNTLDYVENTGFNGNLTLDFDLLKFFTLHGEFAPNFNRTLYATTGTDFSVTDIAAQLGFLFPFTEILQSRLALGLNNTWQNGPKAETQSYLGELGVTLSNLYGISANPAYHISGVITGNTNHKLDGELKWAPEYIEFVDNLTAAGGWLVNLAADNALISDEKNWSLGFKLILLENLSWQTAYNGALLNNAAAPLWQQKLTTQYQHKPVQFLDYNFDLELDLTEDNQGSRFNQKYGAGFLLLPRWNMKIYSFGLTEAFSLSNTDGNDLLLSRLMFRTAVPVLEALSLRYHLEWEWVNRITQEAGAGNAFRHLAGFTVQEAPIALLFEYAFSHGYRGLRQDVLTDLTVSLYQGFKLHSRIALNAFSQDDIPLVPFLGELNLVYEF